MCDFYTLFQYIDTSTKCSRIFSRSSARAAVHFLVSHFWIATACGTGSNVTFTDIGGGVCRAFITTAVASGISNSFTIPTNWNSGSNYIEGIGGGGGGCGGSHSCGASGGEYRRVNNFSASGGASIAIVVGAGGTGGGSGSDGTDGATTTFNSITLKADWQTRLERRQRSRRPSRHGS